MAATSERSGVVTRRAANTLPIPNNTTPMAVIQASATCAWWNGATTSLSERSNSVRTLPEAPVSSLMLRAIRVSPWSGSSSTSPPCALSAASASGGKVVATM